MIKFLKILLFILVPHMGMAQYVVIGNSTLTQSTERYVQSSPTNMQGNRRVIERVKDSTYHKLMSNRLAVTSLGALKDDGFPTNMLFSNDTGLLQKSPVSYLFDSLAVLYYDKAESDGRYYPIPGGTTADYITGDGSVAPFPPLASGTVTSVGITSTDLDATGGPITTAGNITLGLKNSGVSAGSYDRVNVNAKGIVTGGSNATINNAVTRPINGTTYTISATQSARVYYTIRIACTASIGSASSGLVLLQYSTNGGSSWIDMPEVQNSNTVTLAIVLNAVTIQTGVIAGEVPANALCRMTTTQSGTTTVAYVRGQEVLY